MSYGTHAPARVAAGSCLLAAGAAAAVLHAAPSLQLRHRAAALAAAFIPYGLLAFSGAAAAFGSVPSRGARRLTSAALAGVALHAWWAKPYWPSKTAGQGTISVLTMNLRCDSGGVRHFATLVERVQPDVAVLVGFDEGCRDLLGTTWVRHFPYSTFHPKPHLPECGAAVFSSTPLRTVASASDQPVIEVGGDQPFLVLPVDLPTPSKGVGPWVDAFGRLTDTVAAHAGTPLVVAGDFNAVREHAPLRSLLQTTNLRDAAEAAGRGWKPTFPSTKWFAPLLALDHVLISEGIAVGDVRTLRVRSQGHRAVVARIGLRDPYLLNRGRALSMT